jgi:hypothetical protein
MEDILLNIGLALVMIALPVGVIVWAKARIAYNGGGFPASRGRHES